MELCAACRTEPAVLYCDADLAYLCALCDHTIHSANKLAQRHTRIPLRPPVVDSSETSTVTLATSSPQPPPPPPPPPPQPAALHPLLDALVPTPQLSCIAGALVQREAHSLLQNAALSLHTFASDALVPQLLHTAPSPPPPQPPRARERRQRKHALLLEHEHEHEQLAQLQQQLPQLAELSLTDQSDRHVSAARCATRLAALQRFRRKRANRTFTKRVRYACRKQLADSRPRVKGRFVGRNALTPIANS